SRFWIRGDFRRPGHKLKADVPRVIAQAMTTEPVSTAAITKPHLRADLAKWATRREQPLTARVMVNRIWQHHFGRGLAASPSDFGWLGEPPSHPELLDWLAVELIEHDWSLKHIHRLILNSATYQRASRPLGAEQQQSWDELIQADPDNRLLGRHTRLRLDGESLRDALLSVAGVLNRKTGGAGVFPELPPEVVRTLLKDQ
ncbi:MAG: DUF1553 domain-containing protein, partial [Verrucomicrobiae bacterium]|nr:DUF1553 domain-containing protein [Verrucomicrobiae bacterium]